MKSTEKIFRQDTTSSHTRSPLSYCCFSLFAAQKKFQINCLDNAGYRPVVVRQWPVVEAFRLKVRNASLPPPILTTFIVLPSNFGKSRYPKLFSSKLRKRKVGAYCRCLTDVSTCNTSMCIIKI
jgi:hypothetical protein